jgi:diamine N-acetyltransferase
MLIGERVRLRALERDDLPTLVRWMNDPDVRRNLLVFEPISTMAEERWLEGLLDRPDDYVFGVDALAPTGHSLTGPGHLPSSADRLADGDWRHIGNVGLHGLNRHHRRAEIGIVIGEKDSWGVGYGSEALALMMRFAFHELGLHRVELEVFENNLRAIKTYRALGFVEEGVRREAIYQGGRFIDAIRMGVLRGEFDARFGLEG